MGRRGKDVRVGKRGKMFGWGGGVGCLDREEG